jgi:hypothetical protein
MRAIIALFAFLSCGLLATAASAQPGPEPLLFGWEETVVPVVDLSPQQQAAFRQAWNIELHLNVGFAYRRAFIFREGFSLWNWRGRHVLFDGDNVAEITPAELANLIGPDRVAALRPPFEYRVPAGLTTIVVLVLIAVAAIYLVPTQGKKVRRLLNDARYIQAAEIYAATLPKPEEETALEHRKLALATAIDFLVTDKSVPRTDAEANLRMILSLQEEQHSKYLRQQALAHEEAGEWNEALDLYEEAAELRELWDAKDFAFLQKCIARVEKKQAASGDENLLG